MKHVFTTFVLAITLLVCGGGAGLAQDNRTAWAAYERGDYTTAFREWSSLAAQGDAFAQNGLGLLFGGGKGVTQDDREAFKWHSLSAEQGFEMAQFTLGYLYQQGRGVARDYRAALKWYRLAAEQGNALAQNNLGQMYGLGQGVAQDYVYSHMWFNIAASNGIESAARVRDSAAREMTNEQIAEAQRLARECQRKNYKGC